VSAAKRLVSVEESLSKLQKERDGFAKALGDPNLTTWVADMGRAVPRKLSTFEAATVKRIAALDAELEKLEDRQVELRAQLVCELAGVPSDSETQDPEILLRAALVVLFRWNKAGKSTVLSRTVAHALTRYLKSLADDEDED